MTPATMVAAWHLSDPLDRPAAAEPADLLVDPLQLIVTGSARPEGKLSERQHRLHAVIQTATIK